MFVPEKIKEIKKKEKKRKNDIFVFQFDRGKPWKLNVSSTNIKNRKSDEQNGLLKTEIGKPKHYYIIYMKSFFVSLFLNVGLWNISFTRICTIALKDCKM